ncbi:exonuclease [Xanthomonas phage Xaa_vB_phi31]|uniref:Exonuclease n=1 Tax=Xanthomonas phage Xaa_vB_phi31 TaxID=2776752 RepID=A0A868C0H9_9CAUD|nr:exonuclease [Xanthomonas phage Xaa_vB_phi31]
MTTAAERLKEHARNAPMPGTTARPPVEGMPLHIDGDYAAYYCAGNDETSPGTARQNLLDRIERAKQVSGATRVIVHLSDRACDKGLRFFVAQSKPYQGQRNTGRKPQNWDYLREYMETYEGDAFEVKNWIDREADDGMAYVSEAAYKIGRPGAVLTADKDMRMFAGLHIVWKTFEMVEVTPGTYDLMHDGKQYGHKWFWMQMLMGDTADNIMGLPRVGEVAAVKALAGTTSNAEAYPIVLDMYRSKMGDAYADHFVEQAALLWMRTDKGAYLRNFAEALALDWGTDVARAAVRMERRVMEERDALYASKA